jgi:large conductance mechanosensitive channel
MGMVKEFREFATRGNVMDLAVAVIIGAAFSAIISSFVDDVITPLLLAPALEASGLKDLDDLTWGAVKYGRFLSAILQFIMIALVLFLLLKSINKLQRKKEVEAATPAEPELTLSEKLLVEIRDSLRK